MLYAKRYYVRNLLPKKLGDVSMTFALSVRSAVIWLHDSFNHIHIRPYDGDTCDGVELLAYPSKYKIDRAVNILKKWGNSGYRYGQKQAINGASGQVDATVSAIFYYAAFFLNYTKEPVSPQQRHTITGALMMATKSMEKDHRYRMKSKAKIVNSLINTLTDAHAECKSLKAGWKNHIANEFPYVKEETWILESGL